MNQIEKKKIKFEIRKLIQAIVDVYGPCPYKIAEMNSIQVQYVRMTERSVYMIRTQPDEKAYIYVNESLSKDEKKKEVTRMLAYAVVCNDNLRLNDVTEYKIKVFCKELEKYEQSKGV